MTFRILVFFLKFFSNVNSSSMLIKNKSKKHSELFKNTLIYKEELM